MSTTRSLLRRASTDIGGCKTLAVIDVRQAEAEDAVPIAEVFIRSFKTLDFLPTLHTDDEHREFIRARVEEGEVWIAETAGTIVGLAASKEMFFVSCTSTRTCSDRGAGSALLDQVKKARPTGFTFWVFQQNIQARSFYERHGCRVVRLTDGSGNDERTPDALYEWCPVPES